MVPPLTLLTHLLAGIVAKLGIAQLSKHGYLPQSTYVKAALKALEKDDLDEAVRNYQLALVKKRPTDRTEVAYEIILSAIAVRIAKLQSRFDEIEAIVSPPIFSIQFLLNLAPSRRQELDSLREEQAGCEEAIVVLNRIKGQISATTIEPK